MHWEKTGFTPYELPLNDSRGAGEREFLMQPRTLNGERSRLKRIMSEFEHGFRSLRNLGPAVTVFGSARFIPGHPYYELGRQVGGRLAGSGFTVITGGRNCRALHRCLDFALALSSTPVTSRSRL